MAGVTEGFGPAVIAWTDLRAWCDLTGERLEPWEARVLVVLGSVRASIASEKMEREAKRGPDHPR